MKIVYVITGAESNYFVEQCFLSIYSLKKYNNDAYVYVLTDSETDKYIKQSCQYIVGCIDEIVSCDFSEKYDARARSRLLKTRMRELIKGDFLYIDSDTIICGEIPKEIAEFEIAAVPDNHSAVTEEIYEFIPVIARAEKCGYSVGYNGIHFNGGVMWCRDSEKVHSFFLLWNELWSENYKKGIYIDQLSLNEANDRLGGVINELDGNMNCMLRYGLRFLSDAVIIHYFASNSGKEPRRYGFYFEDAKVYEEIRTYKGISHEIAKAMENPKRMFSAACIIEVGTFRYKILNSEAYKMLEYLYCKNQKLYKVIDNICKKAGDLYRKGKHA